MELKDILITGIPEIDTQHEFFIKLIEKLDSLMKREYLPNELDEIVIEISKYARKHFDTEERYFKKFNYPKTEEHQLQHLKLINQVNKFYDGLLYSCINPKDLHSFLLEWTETHLKKDDKKYVDYFNKIGAIK